MAQIQVVIVTPEATTLDQMVDSVIVPMLDGAAGVLAGHAPTIGRLGPGELKIREGSTETSYYVDGGFVQIADNVVSVLTGNSVAVDEIDIAAAKEALEKAEAMESGNADLAELKTKAVQQAKSQLRLAERA